MANSISNHIRVNTTVWLAIIICSMCLEGIAEPVPVEAEVGLSELEYFTGEPTDELPLLDDQSTLDDYLAYAALNNPGLRAAFEEWKEALFKIPQARSLPDPQFSFAWFIREVETRVGPQEQKVGLSQMFPWFGALDAREEMAVAAANARKENYEFQKLRLFYSVKNVYYECYYLSRSIDITEKNMKLLTSLEAVARSKYRSGDTLSATVQAQVELGKLTDQLTSLKDFREPLTAKFNSILDRPLASPLPRPNSVDIAPVSLNNEDLSKALVANNPELIRLDYQKAREQASIELAEKDFYPKMMFGLEAIHTGDSINLTRDRGKDPVIAMLSINLPIWRDKYRAGKREAEARYASVDFSQVNRTNKLMADLHMAYYYFRDAERKIDLFKDTLIPKAQQSLSVVQKSYEAGKSDFLNLIDAERVLLEFELSYERAVANRMQRLAEMELLVGKPLSSAQ